MNQGMRTLIFAGVALVAVVLAAVTFPRPIRDRIDNRVGKPLFPEFQDPLAARDLRIVDYNADSRVIQEFDVAEKHGRWVIPSHYDYPADAEKKIEEAATVLVDRKVIGIARTQLPVAEQETLGVVEPTEENAAAGKLGLGKMITMRNQNGDVLASLIVGKPVKDAEGQRFVRVPGQDVVYTLEINPDDFSTRFEDWIEKDLLQLNAFDVRQIELKDYSIQRKLSANSEANSQGALQIEMTAQKDPRLEIQVAYNEQQGNWALQKLEEYRDGRMQPTELLPTEELNQERIDQLKDSLVELQIVDVQPKPKGLDADLKADKSLRGDTEAQKSLAGLGFFLSPTGEIYGSEGEVLVRDKTGVEYVLRFGETTDLGTDATGKSLSRFLFIVARLDESQFPSPELLPMPPEPQAVPPAPSADQPPAPSGDQPPAPAPVVPTEQPPAVPAEQPAPPAAEPADSSAPVPAPTQQPESAAPADDAPAPPVDNPTPPADVAPPAEPAPNTAPPADNAPPVTQPPATTEPTQPPVAPPSTDAARAAYEAQRDLVTKENQRRIDEYNDRRKKAENRVKELNFRFAGWYYVISDEMYKKIHLNRADVITESAAAKEEGFGIDAFRDLEEYGVEGKPKEEDHGHGDFPPGMMPFVPPH